MALAAAAFRSGGEPPGLLFGGVGGRFWSLAATAGTDAVVSNDPVEMAALTESILGSHPPRYRELCNPQSSPGPGPGHFCSDHQLGVSGTFSVLRGPFIAWDNATLTAAVAHRRCRDRSPGDRLLVPAASGSCDGERATPELLLGHAQLARDGLAQRALRRCQTTLGAWYHTVDGACLQGGGVVLGYVI